MTVTHADICLAGITLNPVQVSATLGIAAHWGRANGDTYVGRTQTGAAITRTFENGVWHLYSNRYTASRDPADHARSLLALIYPLKAEWLRLLDSGLSAGMWVVHAQDRYESGYTIDVDSLRQLAELRVWVGITSVIIDSPEEDAP